MARNVSRGKLVTAALTAGFAHGSGSQSVFGQTPQKLTACDAASADFQPVGNPID